MSLSVGIVGLPNVGKSTLFNALLKRQVALAANYPFATVEPNKGMAQVPDERLGKIARVWAEHDGETGSRDAINRVSTDDIPPLKPATIEFVDIAGLVAGASKGEGLGNKFLANIRECDLICHVLRSFEDSDVVQTGQLDPAEDLETIRTELILKDLETVEKKKGEKRKEKERKEREFITATVEKLSAVLGEGKMANSVDWSEDELDVVIKPLSLLTMKPEIFVVNVSEEQLADDSERSRKVRLAAGFGMTNSEEDIVVISAKIEAELAELEPDEQKEYLKDLGIETSGIEQMATTAYHKLGLISFLTVGKIEAKAWSIKKAMAAPEAAGVIHTDFTKKFIKAQVIDWQQFVEVGGWKKAREIGKVRQEGKEYVMQDGDVVEFMIGK